LAELTATRPDARIRRWRGLLTPGLRHALAVPLLEAAYHPDPREAGELGTEPLTGDALTALAPDEARWGSSARRGLQRLLAHGTTAVTGPFTRPSVRTAVARSGLRVRAPGAWEEAGDALPHAPLSYDPLPYAPLDVLSDDRMTVHPLDRVVDGELTIGGPADFAVFAIPVDEPVDEPMAGAVAGALRRAGAASCIATVLAGRLVHRRA
ncbi:hypothetical protein ACWF94_33705, partial [Streptomyces sp. NPDC055078]